MGTWYFNGQVVPPCPKAVLGDDVKYQPVAIPAKCEIRKFDVTSVGHTRDFLTYSVFLDNDDLQAALYAPCQTDEDNEYSGDPMAMMLGKRAEIGAVKGLFPTLKVDLSPKENGDDYDLDDNGLKIDVKTTPIKKYALKPSFYFAAANDPKKIDSKNGIHLKKVLDEIVFLFSLSQYYDSGKAINYEKKNLPKNMGVEIIFFSWLRSRHLKRMFREYSKFGIKTLFTPRDPTLKCKNHEVPYGNMMDMTKFPFSNGLNTLVPEDIRLEFKTLQDEWNQIRIENFYRKCLRNYLLHLN